MSQLLPYEILLSFCSRLFQSFEFTKEESEQIGEVLLTADLFGIESHGISRILKYTRMLEKGIINIGAVPEVVKKTPISTVYDAHSCMGQLVSIRAMKETIENAKKQGIFITEVRNSNHYGIAGYYAMMASRENLIGISMTNTVAIQVPTFSAQALLGSNPIAFSMPVGGKENPFLFDAATTVITRGKLELYHKLGKELDNEWVVNDKGEVSTNPKEVLDCISDQRGGGILPVGGAGEELAGYKGYGFAMICEIMTSVLAGGVSAIHKTDQGDTSHCFMALDYGMFGEKQEIEGRMNLLVEELHEAKKATGQERIFIPGEKEFEKAKERKKHGLPINEQTLKELSQLAQERKIPGL